MSYSISDSNSFPVYVMFLNEKINNIEDLENKIINFFIKKSFDVTDFNSFKNYMFQNINPLAKSTAIWEIALMLLGAFILGYLFCKWRCWGKSCNCDCNNCDKCTGGNTKVKNNVKANVSAKADTKAEVKNNFAWAGNSSSKDDLKKVEGHRDLRSANQPPRSLSLTQLFQSVRFA
jgi:hypothetical protein